MPDAGTASTAAEVDELDVEPPPLLKPGPKRDGKIFAVVPVPPTTEGNKPDTAAFVN